MSDPTLTILSDLEDPAKFVRVDNVPIFCPHARQVRLPDGTAVGVTVTEEDLQAIAQNVNRAAEEDGVLLRIKIGRAHV